VEVGLRSKAQRTLEGSSRSCSVPNELVHRKNDDILFRIEVSLSLHKLLKNKQIKDTWGYDTASNVSELLDLADLPRTNLEPGVQENSAQAFFFSTDEAKPTLGRGFSVNIPIFANGQQGFTWSSDARPISQLLKLFIPY
jgi:hypothetical protein